MRNLNNELKSEIRAFDEPMVFVEEILGIDWLWEWQENTFKQFYNDGYNELIACVGQRCLPPDTKVMTVDGSYRKVEDLDDGDILYGMDFEEGKIKTDNCLVHKNDEEKEIVEVEVWTGKKIKLSADHKVYTERGLVEAGNLEVDEDYVYIPYKNDNGYSSENLRKLDELNLDEYYIPQKLNPIINKECFFDKVVSVKSVGKSETYDITMPKLGNFFAEDILVKNSGKTLLASLFATYEVFKLLSVRRPNSFYNMPKGSDIFVINVATSQTQAKDTIFSEIESRIENSDWFQSQNYKKRAREYEFFTDENSVVVRSEHSNSSSIAGHTAKCIAEGSRVITPNGYKNIEDINKNDKVQDIGLDDVVETAYNGKDDIIKLETSKGYSIRCTKDHKIMSYVVKENKNDGYGVFDDYSFEFIEAGDILERRNNGENIYTPILLQGAEHLDNEYKTIGDIKFPLNFKLGYILGYFIGDGNFGNGDSGYCIYVSDEKHKKRLTKYIKEYFNFEPRITYRESDGTYGKSKLHRILLTKYIRVILNKLIDKSQRFKHNNAEVFDIIYESNEKMINGFLSGLFDADGCYASDYEAKYTMKSKDFAEEVQDLLRLIGIYSTIYHDKREDSDVYSIRINGYGLRNLKEKLDTIKEPKAEVQHNDLMIPAEPLFNSKNRTGMPDYRKNNFKTRESYKKYVDDIDAEPYSRYINNDFLFDEVVDVEELGKEDVYDIQVDNDRHEYTVEGFKVHNCVLLDEVARFKDTGGATSAEMVYETLKRTTRTFGKEGKTILISSPLYKDDFLMRMLRHGKNQDDVMTIHKATWECNPNIVMDDLSMEFERNPESAWRDYGARPPESLETYFKEPERIDMIIDKDIPTPEEEYEIPNIESIKAPCYIAGDPALKNDAFGIAMCHNDPKEDEIVVDLAHSFNPSGREVAEIDARKVTDFIINLIDKHNVVGFVTDVWNFPSALQRIKETGTTVEQNTVSKEEYDRLKEKIYTRNIRIPSGKLISELKELELVNGKKVDHPNKGSKDVADAVANAVWACDEEKDDAIEPVAMII